jgi:plastocyanin
LVAVVTIATRHDSGSASGLNRATDLPPQVFLPVVLKAGTATPPATATPGPSATPTGTVPPGSSPTPTNTPSITPTPGPPTNTPTTTPTPTITPTPTVTPSPTNSPTATNTPTATPTTPPPTAVSVNIGPAIAFSPADVTLKAGGTVTWTWQGSFSHTTTSGTCVAFTCTSDGKWDSGTPPGTPQMAPATFQAGPPIFDTVGDYRYFCRVHLSSMTGVIHVVN